MKMTLQIPLELARAGEVRIELYSRHGLGSYQLYLRMRTNRRLSKALLNMCLEDETFATSVKEYLCNALRENDVASSLATSDENAILRGTCHLHPSGKHFTVALLLRGYATSVAAVKEWLAEREGLLRVL